MKKALSLALLGLSFIGPSYAAELTGRVVHVADGDTLTVHAANNQTYRIRILAIDAPEKNQPHADESKDALARLIMGKDVHVDWSRRDPYDRLVGRITVEGVDVGLAMIGNGLAWHFKRYQSQQSRADQLAYDGAETAARSRHRGVWSDANPLPPWIFRRN